MGGSVGGVRTGESTDGGVEPVWAPDGRELFCWKRNKLHVVGVTTGDTFQDETPTTLDLAGQDKSNANATADTSS